MEQEICAAPETGREAEEAFAVRVMAMEQSLYRLALAMLHRQSLAEDAVAETVYKAYCARRRLREPEKLKAWLFQILVNQCRTVLRKRGKEVLMEQVPEVLAEPTQPLELWDMVQRLPEGQQSVIVLYYYEGYSVREIGKLLGLRESAVRTRMCRGRETLRQWLEGEA